MKRGPRALDPTAFAQQQPHVAVPDTVRVAVGAIHTGSRPVVGLGRRAMKRPSRMPRTSVESVGAIERLKILVQHDRNHVAAVASPDEPVASLYALVAEGSSSRVGIQRKLKFGASDHGISGDLSELSDRPVLKSVTINVPSSTSSTRSALPRIISAPPSISSAQALPPFLSEGEFAGHNPGAPRCTDAIILVEKPLKVGTESFPFPLPQSRVAGEAAPLIARHDLLRDLTHAVALLRRPRHTVAGELAGALPRETVHRLVHDVADVAC